MNDSDNKIDMLISRHLGKQLDRHLGRAQKAFLAEVSQRRRWYIPSFRAAAAVLLIAASVVCVIAFKDLFKSPKNPDGSQQIPSERPPLFPVAQTVAWQTTDDGTVMMNGDIPVRQLRRKVVERIKWYDAERNTTVELQRPQEQVMLIGYW